MRKELKISAIQNGTVIDHITAGMALKVLHILGLDVKAPESTVSVIMHVPSRAHGFKDIVKIEDRELKKRELNRIALLSPHATINIIREGGPVQLRERQLHHQHQRAGLDPLQGHPEGTHGAQVRLLRQGAGRGRHTA